MNDARPSVLMFFASLVHQNAEIHFNMQACICFIVTQWKLNVDENTMSYFEKSHLQCLEINPQQFMFS